MELLLWHCAVHESRRVAPHGASDPCDRGAYCRPVRHHDERADDGGCIDNVRDAGRYAVLPARGTRRSGLPKGLHVDDSMYGEVLFNHAAVFGHGLRSLGAE